MANSQELHAQIDVKLANRAASSAPMNAIDTFIGNQPEGSRVVYRYLENAGNANAFQLRVNTTIVVTDRPAAAAAFSTFVNSALFASGDVIAFGFTYTEKEIIVPPEE